MIEYVASAVLVIVVPATGWLVNKVIDTDKQMAAHAASDVAQFKAITDSIMDFKDEQRDQSQKLDRLIEGNLRDATQANINHATELRVAAASALVIVERAKDSALAVVAEAARVAKTINPI